MIGHDMLTTAIAPWRGKCPTDSGLTRAPCGIPRRRRVYCYSSCKEDLLEAATKRQVVDSTSED